MIGNTLSNISNNGLAATYNNEVYFVNVYRGEDLYKECGKMYSQITDDKVKNINIKDGMIYYTTLMGKLKCVKTNGQDKKTLIRGPVENIIVTNDSIYYLNILDNYSLYKYDLQTLEVKKISSSVCDKINVVNDKIYFIKCSDDIDWYGTGSIYSIDTNGENEGLVLDVEVNNLIFDDNYLYYTAGENMYKLFRFNVLTGEKELVINSKVGSFNIIHNNIYFSNLSDEGKLYRSSSESLEFVKVSDDIPENINIVGEYMYFANAAYGYPYRLYKMRLNGEDKQMI